MKKFNPLALILIIVAAFSRFLDFAPNFSPIEAISLFGAAVLTSRMAAYAVPIVAMYTSDLILNNTVLRPFFTEHEGFILFDKYMIFNFIAMICIVALGRVLLKKVTGLKVLFSALSASALFFFITNIGSWLSLPIYSKDLAGLSASFLAGLPFYQTSWISTVLFTCFLFGAHYLLKRVSIKESFETA